MSKGARLDVSALAVRVAAAGLIVAGGLAGGPDVAPGVAEAAQPRAADGALTTRQDALYTNSTLALNPRTGQGEWYFQHAPGETLDLDIVYERVLVDADGEQWLFTIGKDGILWKLDRRTGALVELREPVYQDAFESIDRATGELTAQPETRLGSCPRTGNVRKLTHAVRRTLRRQGARGIKSNHHSNLERNSGGLAAHPETAQILS